MSSEATSLPPKLLAFWTRCLRTTQHWSQDALAAASGLTTRTIQRIEAGAPSTVSTRRSLARAFGYDDPDIFDRPEFARDVQQFIDIAQRQKISEEYPDHMSLPAAPVGSGDALARLIGASQAYVFDCAEGLGPNAKQHAASLFDLIHDYGDIWSELTHADRMGAAAEFDKMLRELEEHDVGAYSALRTTKIVGTFWPDQTPMPITIGYLTLAPADRKIERLMVPKGIQSHVG